VTRFPFAWHHLSFYTVAAASLPRLDRCRQWRRQRTAVVS
jgi:hypothetical protein